MKSYYTAPSPENLKTGGCRFETPAMPILFPRIDDSQCNRIDSFLTAIYPFEGWLGKSSWWLGKNIVHIIV